MAETLTIRTASSTEIIKIAVPGPQGPKGDKGDPGDVAGLPLSTQGDTLYRGASQNERLPIGSAGQILKVSAGGIPEWGAAPASGVTSVNGETGAVTLTPADLDAADANHSHNSADVFFAGLEISGAGNANTNGVYVYGGDLNGKGVYYKDKDTFVYWDGAAWTISYNTNDIYSSAQNTTTPWQVTAWSVEIGQTSPAPSSWDRVTGDQWEAVVGQRTNPTLRGDAAGKNVGTGANDVAAGNDSRFTDARQPLSHSSTHHAGGTDAIAPNQISAAWAQVLSNQTITGNTLLAAGRNRRITLLSNGATANIDLPYGNSQAGDLVTLVSSFTGSNALTIRRAASMSQGVPIAYTTLATLNASGQSFTFVSDGTDTGWSLRAVDTHTHTFGTTAGTFTEGNDARLSDSRTPTAHTHDISQIEIGDPQAFLEDLGGVLNTDARLSDSRTPTAHAASHASAGSDPVFDQNLNTTDSPTFESLSVANQFNCDGAVDFSLASSIALPAINTSLAIFENVNEITGTFRAQGESLTANRTYDLPNASGTLALTSDIPSTFAASAITSGTLAHERGGLEADVSAYNGLVKISGGSTSAVTVTSAGEALLDDVDAAAQRTTLGLGTAATAATGDFAAASHTHELTALAATGATNGHVLTANGSNGVTFAALPASGVTGAASSASDVLGVSGSNITGVDANADRLIFWDDSASALKHLTVGSGLSLTDTTLTATGGGVTTGSVDNAVLRADGTGGSTSQGSAINIEDASTTTENNVAITNQHTGQTNSSLVLTPKGTGAFIVGPRPDGTATGGNARGAGAICIQTSRNAANQVASAADSIAIGNRSRSSSALGESVAIGFSTTASGSYSTCVGGRSTATGTYTTALGHDADATQSGAIALGDRTTSSTAGGVAVGSQASATNDRAIAIGESASCSGQYAMSAGYAVSATANYAIALNSSASLRAQFATLPFSAVYWGGQTTNNTATILNLDATATNRFTIAANTALAVDILLVARRSDVADKWLVARRFLGIRRDGSNNTSLIGTVQNFGMTDQSGGSPTWSFALTADDTNDALQLEVTGATGETVQWRACAIYRVV